MKKHLLTLIGAVLFAITAASSAHADNSSSFTSYARVTGVEPVYKYFTVHEPQRHCSYVTPSRVHHHQPHRHHRPHRHQRRVFVSGESYTGNRSSRNERGSSEKKYLEKPTQSHYDGHGHNRHHRNRRNRQCVTTTVSRQERRHDGYRVTYVYRGNTFQARTDYHPGDRIRVTVAVKPH